MEAKPKVLGLSIQGCNEAAAREVAFGVKAQLPDVIIVVGGFSCYNPDVGRRAFPECDYMCIGEADLTVGPLFEALARGDRPFNQAGVLSRFDTPEHPYIPAPMIHDLDQIEFPKYEWCDLSVYRNFNDYQLTPIIASRGCRWSRCTFCAERFYWRIRTPENFVDELEWLVSQGCYLFMFNESDLGGMPERVMEICDEIIRRGLHRKVKLTGQLRVNKKQDRAFFAKLREANFVALRFGIDAFSEHTLRLQMKGYTVRMIEQNLRDCWEVGIFTEINWVIGVPGETDQDVEEGIELILRTSKYIGRLANINPLILVNGSVYWIDPASHNIVFKEPKEQMYEKYPRALPADQWHSTDPYIDAQVRKERFEQIVIALYDAGFNVGAWANRVIDDVKMNRDKVRTSSADGSGVSAGEFEVAGVVETENHLESIEEKQAAEAVTQTSSVDEEPVKLKAKEIPMYTPETTEVDNAKTPPAKPPLFGVAGAAPYLVCKMATHHVLFYNGLYYGVPNAMGHVDLTNPDIANGSGIIKSATKEEVVAAIEEGNLWADSRGRYDDQRKQRKAGSYMRVDSVGGMSEVSELPDKPKILQFGNLHIAVDQRRIEDAVSTLQYREENVRTQDGTIFRKIAAALPTSMVSQIKMLSHQESDNGLRAALIERTDGQIVRRIFRAAAKKYVVLPLKRIINDDIGHDSSNVVKHSIVVKGERYSILSVVTKNAQPELMWTIDNYNLVKFDGLFYGVPQGASVDWDSGMVESIHGMLVGQTIGEVVSLIGSGHSANLSQERLSHLDSGSSDMESTKVPVLLRAMPEEGYNIVSYEGWVYGMPHELGPIDLAEVDVIEMPNVIRDVSFDVVENEILERADKTVSSQPVV